MSVFVVSLIIRGHGSSCPCFHNMKFILAKEGSDLILCAVVEATQCAAVRTWEWSSREPPQKSPPLDLRATLLRIRKCFLILDGGLFCGTAPCSTKL